MTLEEKAALLTGGSASLSTAGVPRLGIKPKNLADGPNGERNYNPGTNSTTLPSCCATGATWNPDMAYLMGETIANDCVHHNIQMILGPGLNMKRNALCGRNFEYFSEDPVLTGIMAAAYVNGCEENGVGTSAKHYACNSQETRRTETNVEVDERTLREIYTRAFEIMVKNSKPASIMCAYNKVGSMWCSENRMLLSDMPRKEWGYEGVMVSDWGAVHDPVKAVKAGLDLNMPHCESEVREIVSAVNEGRLSMDYVDESAGRVLEFLLRDVREDKDYDRKKQHENALKIAQEAVCLLKNGNFRNSTKEWPVYENHAGWSDTDIPLLPLTPDKVKKVAVTGEYAVMPYTNGQGSAEVKTEPDWIDTPLDCLRKNLPGVQVDYFPYLTRKQPDNMLWHTFCKDMPDIQTYDAVIVFTGVQPSQDSENIDRFDNHLAGYIEDVLRNVTYHNPNSILVLCSGSSTFRSDKADACTSIIQMWPTGEACGQAVADVITGKINPSGKLSETFPTEMRRDIDLNGDGMKIEYTEKSLIGYRYYDYHPEKVWFPFGHGLSYTKFEYTNAKIKETKNGYRVTMKLKNVGDRDGAEVVQLYVGDPVSTVTKPKKELKKFKKVFLRAGESANLTFDLTDEDFAYYNTMLHDWVVESGRYDIYLAASAQDVRLTLSIDYENPDCYTMQKTQEDMIG